ncbi:hypothetical protein M8J77_010366 [Diaphorina citri]|nr:hypothetical protein M8J77_010366 [Diaphorina citri]
MTYERNATKYKDNRHSDIICGLGCRAVNVKEEAEEEAEAEAAAAAAAAAAAENDEKFDVFQSQISPAKLNRF